MAFLVYVIYSPSANQFYKGQTSDLQERLIRHNAGRERYTASGAPWKLVWTVSKPTRGEALSLESKLKNLSRARLIQFMLKYKEQVAGPDELTLLRQLSGC